LQGRTIPGNFRRKATLAALKPSNLPPGRLDQRGPQVSSEDGDFRTVDDMRAEGRLLATGNLNLDSRKLRLLQPPTVLEVGFWRQS
jgi:hypothetical protein